MLLSELCRIKFWLHQILQDKTGINYHCFKGKIFCYLCFLNQNVWFSGQFLYVGTDFASAGDKVFLRSAPFTLQNDSIYFLSMDIHSYTDLYGTQAQLEVFLKPVNQLEYKNMTLKIIDLTKESRKRYGKKPKFETYEAYLPRGGMCYFSWDLGTS